LAVNPVPVCTVTGDATVCSGTVGHTYSVTSDQTGSTFSWQITGNGTIQGTTTGATVTVDAGAAGTYTLTVTVTKGDCTNTCSLTVTVNNCAVNCPRTPGFWTQQCAQKSGGSTKFTVANVTSIATCIDNSVAIFNWSSDEFAGFCNTINPPSPMDVRKQALRQFASFLANICTGQLGLIANNGDKIFLDLTTPIACGNLTSTTLGGLIGEVDAILVSLQGQSLSDPAVKARYADLISCLDGINNGIGIGAVCPGDTPTIGGIGLRGTGWVTPPSPNPFRGTTWIYYSIEGSAAKQVDVRIFDVTGRLVRVLTSEQQTAGRHELVWDGLSGSGTHVPSGLYFIKTRVGTQTNIARILYLR